MKHLSTDTNIPNSTVTMFDAQERDRREPQRQFRFIREGQVFFTPENAKAVVEHCRYERQRDETKGRAHIASLAEQMRRGLWLPKTQIDFADLGGRKILVNGYHRMHAQIEAAATILWNVVIHECADEAELAALYWKFDTTIRKRSSANILGGIGFAEQIGVTGNVARALWDAMPIIALGLRMYRYQTDGAAGGGMMPDERQALALEYANEARVAEELLQLAPGVVRKRMVVASRFAVMLVMLRHQPSAAYRFWRGFCEDDALAKGDPRKALLLDIQSRVNRPGLTAQHMMAIARAWNAYFNGRTTTHIKVTGHAVPLDGTPYTVRA